MGGREEGGRDLFPGVPVSCLTDRTMVRTDSWEGFSPRRCQLLLDGIISGMGGVALVFRVSLCTRVHVRLPGEGPVLPGCADAVSDARCAPYGPTREEKEPERRRFEPPPRRPPGVSGVQF